MAEPQVRAHSHRHGERLAPARRAGAGHTAGPRRGHPPWRPARARGERVHVIARLGQVVVEGLGGEQRTRPLEQQVRALAQQRQGLLGRHGGGAQGEQLRQPAHVPGGAGAQHVEGLGAGGGELEGLVLAQQRALQGTGLAEGLGGGEVALRGLAGGCFWARRSISAASDWVSPDR